MIDQYLPNIPIINTVNFRSTVSNELMDFILPSNPDIKLNKISRWRPTNDGNMLDISTDYFTTVINANFNSVSDTTFIKKIMTQWMSEDQFNMILDILIDKILGTKNQPHIVLYINHGNGGKSTFINYLRELFGLFSIALPGNIDHQSRIFFNKYFKSSGLLVVHIQSDDKSSLEQQIKMLYQLPNFDNFLCIFTINDDPQLSCDDIIYQLRTDTQLVEIPPNAGDNIHIIISYFV